MQMMTEDQKKMMFAIEVLRNRDKVFCEANPGVTPVAEHLFELFMKEIGQEELWEALKDRVK